MNHFIAAQLIAMFSSVALTHEIDESWWDKQFKDISKPSVFKPIKDNVVFMFWMLNSKKVIDRHIMPTQGFKQSDVPGFKPNEPFKIIVTGTEPRKSIDGTIQSSYLNYLDKFNVFSVDWSAAERFYTSYSPDQTGLRVGIAFGYFLKELVDERFVSADKIHLIGIDLGAHIAGSSGRAFNKLTKTKIERITGLDPLICKQGHGAIDFATEQKFLSLDKDNAKFVDVIYTSRGMWIGTGNNIGHAIFLPNNGGPTQPRCGLLTKLWKTSCSHNMASIYYAESVLNRKSFVSVQCSSYKEYKKGKCKNNPTSYMGHGADPTKHGLFYLTTTSETSKITPYVIKKPTHKPTT